MESGLVATVCAGNSLSGGASIRLYARCIHRKLPLLLSPMALPLSISDAAAAAARYGTQANAVVSGTTITVSFFGEVSSTGQIVGEPRTEVSRATDSDRLSLTCLEPC